MNSDIANTEYTPAQEAIALLIDMAKKGEINPWDVQVIEVIDRCLSVLANRTEAQSNNFEANLSQSGQAFLYASMLVLLKADTLSNQSSLPEENLDIEPTDGLELTEFETDADGQLPPNLERRLRRRPTAQPPKKRPVTLEELIEQLQQMAATLEEKPPRPPIRRTLRQSSAQAARAIAELAHQENLTETATQLEQFLSTYWVQKPPEQDDLELEQLVKIWHTVSPSTDNHHLPDTPTSEGKHNHRVGIFWALLLLSAQSKVELTQEEFYQEIKIRSLN